MTRDELEAQIGPLTTWANSIALREVVEDATRLTQAVEMYFRGTREVKKASLSVPDQNALDIMGIVINALNKSYQDLVVVLKAIPQHLECHRLPYAVVQAEIASMSRPSGTTASNEVEVVYDNARRAVITAMKVVQMSTNEEKERDAHWLVFDTQPVLMKLLKVTAEAEPTSPQSKLSPVKPAIPKATPRGLIH